MRLLLSLQACPMNMQPHADPSKNPQEIWEDFSLSFTPAVREVVEFAKHIPGFSSLSQNDQVTLLKAGTFEVRQMSHFDPLSLGQRQASCFALFIYAKLTGYKKEN